MKKTIMLVLLVCCCACLFACEKACEHQYQEAITLEASCSAVGVKTFTCSLCQDSYTEEIPQIEHVWGESFVSKEPTCSEEGESSVSCTVCNETKVIETISVTDHKFEDVVTKKATCAETGVVTPTCKCGEIQPAKEVPKLEHEYTAKVTKEATYRNKGEKVYTCSLCGDNYKESIKKLSANNILDKANQGSKYITEALEYMGDALSYYKYSKHSSCQSATAYMLVKTGLAINCLKEARDLCGNHSDLAEMKNIFSQMISELEYVKKYDSISTSNYINIVLDIYRADVYQNATQYEKQLLDIFEELA